MVVEFGPVLCGIFPGADKPLLFAIPERDTDSTFRPEAEPYNLSRNVDQHRAVHAVIEGPGTEIVRIEVGAEQHYFIRSGRTRDLGNDVSRSKRVASVDVDRCGKLKRLSGPQQSKGALGMFTLHDEQWMLVVQAQ